MKVGYILRKFPILSETFIINEIITLQSLGADIYPVSLFSPENCQGYLMSKVINDTFDLSASDLNEPAEPDTLLEEAKRLAAGYELSERIALLAARVAVYIREKELRLLHAHFATEAALVAMLAAELTGVPFTFTAHAYDIFIANGGEPGECRDRRLKSLVKNAAHAIAISGFNKNYLLGIAGEEFRDKINVVHCGIDPGLFEPAKREPSEKVTLLCVARFVEKKGHEFLLRSFEKAASALENVRLRLIGEGPLKTAAAELCMELGLEGKVDFLGALPNESVLDEINKADIFVLHSIKAENGDMEGIPVSLMEAMASGLPVISTRHSGIPELVADGSEGFLAEERDIDGFARLIADAVASPEKRKEMGLNGSRLVRNNFNLLTECHKLLDIFADTAFPSYPYVSIVIPVFNGEDTLSLCLDSISKLNYPKERFEVIVVDNGSTDSSVTIVSGYDVTLLHETSIKCSYAARNTGIRAAKGELIAFTDADCIVTAEWLNLIASHWDDESVGCFAGEVEAYEPEGLIEKFSDRQGILRQKGTLSCPYLPYTQTANSAYRKSVFDRIGLFDPEMTSGGDADIAWRMQKKLGLKIKFIPEAVVFHKHRTSIDGLFNQFRKYEHGKISWQGEYSDYELPSPENRITELAQRIQAVTSALAVDTERFIREEIDFVDLLTPFLKYVMSLGTCKARFEPDSAKGSTTTPLISVIIPTYNRAPLLKESLHSLTRQTLPRQRFEVVVIDDGSTDSTGEVCLENAKELRLVYKRIANSGISVAKNIGLALSTAPLVLFFDDDDIAHEHLLQEHLQSHGEYPDENVAVLGYTTWVPSLAATLLMHYVTEIGQHLFSYPKLRHGQVLGYKHFWGGRSSCKKSFLMNNGTFRPEFRFGCEDIELGYRLDRLGFKVIYNQNAISYMNRAVNFDEFCRRCENQGKSQYLFSRLHPDPAIQQYCMAEEIEKKWSERGPLLAQVVAETRRLERLALQDESLVPRLYGNYGWCFETYKIKGLFDEMHMDDRTELSKPANNAQPSPSYGLLPPQSADTTPCSILIIAKELPFHDRSSGNFRLFQIIRILASQGHAVTFLARPSFREIDDAPYIRELEELGVTVHKIAEENAFIKGNRDQDSLCRLLSSNTFDIAYLMFYSVAELYLDRIRTLSPQTRIIVDSVDLHFLREQRQAGITAPARQPGNEAGKARELDVYRKADLVVVLTEVDREALLAEAPRIKTVMVPNIHPSVPPSHKDCNNRRDIVFVGGFTHEPNIDAVEYFCNHIWPTVARRLPDCRLIIAGNAPPPRVTLFASERIIVTGYVQDLPELLCQCRISIAPLRFGAGMKGKVGEALSYGVPVVATTIAAEGMGLVHGEHLLIADKANDFARCVVALYGDDALRERLAINGRMFIERIFSPAAVSEKLQSMLKGVSSIDTPSVRDLLLAQAASCGVVAPDNNSVQVPGRCNVCGSDGGFCLRLNDDEIISLTGRTWVDVVGENRINLRENILCMKCLSSSRNRALVEVLLELYGGRGKVLAELDADRKTNIFEASGMSYYTRILADKFSYLNTSYDREIIARGGYDSRLYADLQQMPYEDNTFDYLISGDVLEHVRDHRAAIAESLRVLKPGGFMIFTVPYKHAMMRNHIMVEPRGDQDIFLEEPVYHGKSRSLVYRVYGRELLDDLAAGGFLVERREMEDKRFGIAPCEVFVCRRPERIAEMATPGFPRTVATTPLTMAIKICTPTRHTVGWGDTPFAECLGRAFEKMGISCRVDCMDTWSKGAKTDIVLFLQGISSYEPDPSAFNIVWIISHPELADPQHLNKFDLIFCASASFAGKLAALCGPPVFFLPQAADPEIFKPASNPRRDVDLLFVGNNYEAQRGGCRKIIADLLKTGRRHSLAIVGQQWWGFVDDASIIAEFVNYEHLPYLYSRARIVLNDHHPEMRREGFINNRTFDLAHAGVFQISDHLEGLEELSVVTYNSVEDLDAKIIRYLADDDARERSAEAVRKSCASYNFGERAREILGKAVEVGLTAFGPLHPSADATSSGDTTIGKTTGEEIPLHPPALPYDCKNACYTTEENMNAVSNNNSNISSNLEATEKNYSELLYWMNRKLQEGTFANRHYEEFYTKFFGIDKGFYKDKKILDIGCGPRGSLEWADNAAERIGLDPLANEYMKLNEGKHAMQYVAAHSESIPFDDGYFDVVCSFNSLDHVDDLAKSIKEIKRVLSPGGIFLLLSEINHAPTTCEPITLSWDIIDSFAPELTLVEKSFYEKNPQGIYASTHIPYDFENPDDRECVLSAKFAKPKMDNPLISILIPTYNRACYLPEAIESALSQCYDNFEVIVVDDGSTDDTAAVLNSFDSKVFRYLLKEHSGAPATRNRCIEEAKGDYLLWLDSDDVLEPGTLQGYVSILNEVREADVIYGNICATDERLTPFKQLNYPDWFGRNDALVASLFCGNSVPNPGTMVKKECYRQWGGYSLSFPRAHDYEFWSRLAASAVFKHCDRTVVKWRWHESNMSTENTNFDTRYDANVMHGMIRMYTMEKLLPAIPWRDGNEKENLTNAYLTISQRLFNYKDYEGAAHYALLAYELYPDEKLADWLKMINLTRSKDEPCQHRVPGEVMTAESQQTGTVNTASATPLVSVIVPTHNRPDMLVETIRSILNQTYRDFEIIVVNDAGADVEGVVHHLNRDGNIVYVRHSRNRGLAAARNTGIRVARGKYIAYLDDDDIFYPDHLETLVNFLEGSAFKVAYSDAHRALQAMESGRYSVTARDLPYSYDFDYDTILVTNFVPVLCFMHEKSCIDQVGLFDENLTTHEDWDMWIRMSRKFKFAHIRKVTCEFTWRKDGSTMSSSSFADFVRTTRVIYDKHRDLAAGNPSIQEARRNALRAREAALTPIQPEEKTDAIVPKKVSIIIPVFNRLEYTRQCISQLSAVTDKAIPSEIIVIDNASTDGTAQFLGELKDDIRIVKNKENLGFARACNQGARLATGDYLVFLNNDTIPQAGWLGALIDGIEHDGADICGSRLLYPDGRVQHAGVAFSEQGIGYHIFNGFDGNDPAATRKRFMQCVTGACMAVARDLFLEMKGFDEGYINGFEDVDLCLRAGAMGKKILYVPESTLVHFEETSEGRKRHDEQNARRFLDRWRGKVRCDDNDFYLREGYRKEMSADGVISIFKLEKPQSLTSDGIRNSDALERRLERADGLAREGKFDDAVAVYRSVLRGDNRNLRAMTGVGVASLMCGRLEEAQKAFMDALEISPADAKALAGLGMVNCLQGRDDDGFDCFSRALDSDPENLTALSELLKISYRLDRFHEAEQRLESYLRYHPADLNILFSLAGVQLKMGKSGEASQKLETILLFDPDFEGALEMRRMIEGELPIAV